MKFNDNKKSKILLTVFIIILVLILFTYANIIQKHIGRVRFAKNNMEVYEKNLEKVFRVEKIILCSSANAIDRSIEKNLKDLSIYQYTDIAVYIDNGEVLTNKSTIKNLYIDNISLEGDNSIGTKSLNYKNTLNFGLKEDIEEEKSKNDKIDFNIIFTNDQEKETDYDEPSFYTDCSNPITLEYLNYNIKNGYQMEENNTVTFDGGILEKSGITTDTIKCKVRFRLNIINNQNEKYSCPINIKIPLDDIYKGTTMKASTPKSKKYVFFREV